MSLIELILFITGAVMFPYGILEILKGQGNLKMKLVLVSASLTLFILESVLAFR
ncbi:hypothetical protein [Metallosphaera hakonensis]|uniref:hypothetical protein n=1 Tax=Metallosphaera hakonensis TaxID=79601 RepID=UPI000A5F75E2|nr:hypothetical protein [Metallosphaera hakonensis]